ncbi:MAG: peptidylprolyl isomerase [Candidatus Marinimicrobia bacterium]|nr:peptidylprolyl isomerase [Candidatus Neomarinimicrobiota bacterium]
MNNAKTTILLMTISGLFLIFTLNSCAKKSESIVLASINQDIISADDFSDDYFQTILYGNTFDSAQKREQHLNHLIDLYILAQKGFQTGSVTELDVESVVRRIRRRKTKEQLLNEEVELKTPQPDESDLKKIYLCNTQKVHVKHLFAKTKTEIDSLYLFLKQGRDFESIAFEIFEDSTLKKSGGDLGWSSFGDLDPFLEDTIYQMKAGSISHPMESRFGWHILKLENKAFNPLTTQYEYERSREKLVRQFIKREQDKRYYTFINNFMSDKSAIIHNPEWGIVMQEIRKRFPADKQVSPMLLQLPYSPEIAPVPQTLEEISDNPIISFPDHEMTVSEFLDRITDQPARMLYGSLKTLTEQLIRDYFLIDEGIRRGLDKSITVKNAVAFQKNLYAGKKHSTMLIERFEIDPNSIDSNIVTTTYDSLKNISFVLRQIFDYSLLVVKDSAGMNLCDAHLDKNRSLEKLIKKYGILKSGTLESGRFNKKREEIPGIIRQTLLGIQNGNISKWLKINNRYVRIQRHSVTTEYFSLDDVSYDLRKSIVKNQTLSILYDSLAVWRKNADINIDKSLLTSLFNMLN